MKRFHVHVSVDNLEQSIRFYSSLFGRDPSVEKPDYAKWMLEDPRVNFAISQRGATPGVNHLGFQLDEAAELDTMRAQLERAGANITAEPGSTCCYAKSDKYWIQDPSGIAWESFRSLSEVPIFGGSEQETTRPAEAKTSCCAPSCCS